MNPEELWRLKTPTDMVLRCPQCHKLHLDIGEFRTRVHRKHLCENTPEGPSTGCGHLWMPSEAPTRGVTFVEYIVYVLRHTRFAAPNDETKVHERIAQALEATGYAFEHEVRLGPRDRIDFLIGSVGIEVKIDGSATEVTRQLLRYAEHATIADLILVTMRSQIVVPAELGGKAVYTVRHYTGL